MEDGLNAARPGTMEYCHSSRWMQVEIRVEWMNHFLQYVKPTIQQLVLLLSDRHHHAQKHICNCY